jgi:LPXTG-motif cell wall-anchored protein
MSELASTGPAETIGYSMLALAMIGGGIAFIVLARRRLA